VSENKIPKVVTAVFLVALFFSIVFLSMSSIQIVSRYWGSNDNNTISDAWGIEIYPNFITYLTISLISIITANLLYITGTWVVCRSPKPIDSSMYWLYSVAGLFLPTVFGYGIPRVLVYGNIQFGNIVSPIIAPLYALDCSVFWGNQLVFSLGSAYIHTLSIGNFVLLLGLLLAIGLIMLERNQIRYRTFLLLIILNVIFSILVMVYGFLTLPDVGGTNPYLLFSIPSYTFGALLLGQKISHT